MEKPRRCFKFKKNRCPRTVEWLKRETVYEGDLLSMTNRTVRLYAPDQATARRPYYDVSYDWLIPVS